MNLVYQTLCFLNIPLLTCELERENPILAQLELPKCLIFLSDGFLVMWHELQSFEVNQSKSIAHRPCCVPGGG
jgi:hypothetical protein